MKYLPHIIVVLALVVFVYAKVLDFGGKQDKELINSQQVKSPTQAQEENIAKTQWETKTDNQSSVTVQITPVEIGENAKLWKFNIIMDTHVEELSQDLVKTTILTDDKGVEYKPVSWEGDSLGGHHRQGVLVFEKINPLTSFIKLKIKDIGGTPERLFSWNLQ